MLIKGTFTNEFSGSVGGITAAHNRGGYYLRSRVVPTDPATAFQTARRNTFRTFITNWTTKLTEVQRESWRLWAANTPFLNPLGDSRPITGQNAYAGCNMLRQQAGLAEVTTAPVIFDRGAVGAVNLDNISAASDDFEVVFDNTQTWATAVGGALLVFGGRPQNQSIQFYKGPWRFIDSIDGAVIAPTSPGGPFINPFPLALNQRLFVRLVALTADGRWTSDVVVSGLVGA